MTALSYHIVKTHFHCLFSPLDNELLLVFEFSHIPNLRQEFKTKQELDGQINA